MAHRVTKHVDRYENIVYCENSIAHGKINELVSVIRQQKITKLWPR